jgi:biofilm PGA synthesis protein PgaD
LDDEHGCNGHRDAARDGAAFQRKGTMDQSGPRHPTLKSPIIDRADLQTLQHRTISGVVTFAFWLIWAYLWVPLLALIAWAVGLEQAYKYMFVLGGYEEVLGLLGVYTLIILIMGGSLVAWAGYNILRFGRHPKRAASAPPTLQEVARHFRQGPLAVESWRQAQRLQVMHDEKGGIARVDVLEK